VGLDRWYWRQCYCMDDNIAGSGEDKLDSPFDLLFCVYLSSSPGILSTRLSVTMVCEQVR
jgi:hypothetical protein